MQNAPTLKVALFWQDREMNKSQLTFHLPFLTSANDAQNFASGIISVVSSITDSVCSGYKLSWSARNTEPVAAAFTSDVRRLGALFYRNGDVYEAIWIPSARQDLTQQSGALAGVRFDEASTGYQVLRDAITQALQETVTPEGEPWPVEYVSGGIVL